MKVEDLFTFLGRPEIQTIAEIVIACSGLKALSIWKKEIMGTDKYKILMDIRRKSLKFKELYQESRCYHVNGIIVYQGFNPNADNSIEKKVRDLSKGDFYKERFRTLRFSFFDIRDSIISYRALIKSDHSFLDKEINTMIFIIQAFEKSFENYLAENTSKETRREAEAYILKSPNEDDAVSKQLIDLIKVIFNETDKELTFFNKIFKVKKL